MSREAHTAGPWVLDTLPNSAAFGASAGRAYGISAKNKGGYRVPVVVWRGIAKPASPEGQANARLIAASPRMYDYIAERSAGGDDEATAIMESIHASR